MEGGSPSSGSEVWLRGVVARDRLLLRSPAGEVRASLAYGAYCRREGEIYGLKATDYISYFISTANYRRLLLLLWSGGEY